MNQQTNTTGMLSATATQSHFGPQPEELLLVLLRRKWLIIASGIIVCLAVVAGTARQRPIYQSVAQLIIDPVLPKVMGDEQGFDTVSEQARTELLFANTQHRVLAGSIVLRRAVAALKLEQEQDFLKDYNLTGATDKLEASVSTLKRLLKVTPHRGSRIASVIVEDYDPVRVAKIANAVVQAYMDFTLDQRREASRGAHEWLNKQVVEFASKLEKAEQNLHEFMRENTLLSVSLEDRRTMAGAKLSSINQKLIDLRTQLLELRAKRLVLGRGAVDANEAILASEVVNNLKTILADLKNKKAELSSRYGPKHHAMEGVQGQIDEVESMLSAEKSSHVQAFDKKIRALNATMSGLENMLETEKEDALRLNELALTHNKLSRDYDTIKTVYESLIKRQAEADLAESLPTNFAHWFEEAEPPLRHIRPSVVRNASLGLLLGVFLGVVIAVSGLLLDNTLRSQQDVEAVGVPFLGILPSIDNDPKVKTSAGGMQISRDLYIVQHQKSSMAECARSIRTNLLFMTTDKPFHRLLITSPGPSEGKSTISINLSVVMAQAGNRVLLVDTDLRKPRLHRTFGVSGELGITSVLLQQASLDQGIKSTSVVGLDVLPCGPLPPNPAELLHTDSFRNLLKELDGRYDRIVFDSPPVNAVTDAAILSQEVDGTLLVGKTGKTEKGSFRRAVRTLAGVNAQLIGTVLNGVDLREGSYGRGYAYYYYYYPRYISDSEKGAEV